MRKLISSVLVASLLGVVGANANNNEIVLKGMVAPSAIVGLYKAVNGDALSANTFTFKDPGEINFSVIAAGGKFEEKDIPVYVKTNIGKGVNIKLTDKTNNGKLTHANGDTIDVTYKYGGDTLTLGTAKSLVPTVNDGSQPTGNNLVIIPAQSDAIQRSGEYTTTLTVEIATN